MINKRHIASEMPWIYMRFYVVGLILFMIPFTRGLFISITTASLVLVIATVFWLNRDWRASHIIWGCFIITSSFLLEYFGVATGAIFGIYHYGEGLAPLIKGTPLIIGFNWVFLIYTTHLIANRTCHTSLGRIFCGSVLMIVYDLAAEWAAPYMDMWSFDTSYPPAQNFLVWFMASLIYHAGFEVFHLRHDNPSARILYAVQIIFFIIIGIFSTIATR